jgi:hypothetical protein
LVTDFLLTDFYDAFRVALRAADFISHRFPVRRVPFRFVLASKSVDPSRRVLGVELACVVRSDARHNLSAGVVCLCLRSFGFSFGGFISRFHFGSECLGLFACEHS